MMISSLTYLETTMNNSEISIERIIFLNSKIFAIIKITLQVFKKEFITVSIAI